MRKFRSVSRRLEGPDTQLTKIGEPQLADPHAELSPEQPFAKVIQAKKTWTNPENAVRILEHDHVANEQKIGAMSSRIPTATAMSSVSSMSQSICPCSFDMVETADTVHTTTTSETVTTTDPGTQDCLLCYEKTITHIVKPCGHVLFCGECIAKVVSTTGTCPLCHTVIEESVEASNFDFQQRQPEILLVQQIMRLMLGERGKHQVGLPFLPWWPIENVEMTSQELELYMQERARLPGGRRGLLVDTGAYGNLTGRAWVREQAHETGLHGMSSKQEELQQPMRLIGVGKGSQTCSCEVTVVTCTIDERDEAHMDEFTEPVLNGEESMSIPAILGLQSLEDLKAVIDCGKGRIHFPGPGGLYIAGAPGTRSHQLEKAISGHWMLPVNDFHRKEDACRSCPLPTSSIQLHADETTSTSSSTRQYDERQGQAGLAAAQQCGEAAANVVEVLDKISEHDEDEHI